MSSMFKPPREFDPSLVKTMLKENALLIKIITEYQNKGRIQECMKYHDILTRNLLYLSGQADFHADEAFIPGEVNQDQSASGSILKKPKISDQPKLEDVGSSSTNSLSDKSIFFNFK